MSKIKELPKSSSHLLQCTQIITSIQTVVKELIENAIDSCSKNIEIKLENYGLDKIEVKDNGSGISKCDIDKVCKPHCTSKIISHTDLNNVLTYGFRGEALAALCAVSDLTITTKPTEEQFGYTFMFGKHGETLSAKPYPCTQGTTVTSLNLFNNLPVRKQYYRVDKNKKEELKKIEDIVYAFGCIHADIRFALFHNKSLIWQKPVVSNVREGLVSIFGRSVVDNMQNCEFSDDEKQVKIEVFLPKDNAPSCCSSTSVNRSIISVNKRPVRMKNIDKVLKQCFSKSASLLGKSRYPICYVSIEVPPSQTDVNVEPNKTAVVLYNIDTVITQLTAILKTFYEPSSEAIDIDKTPKNLEATKKPKAVNLESPLKRAEISIIPSPALNMPQRLIPTKKLDKSMERKKSAKTFDVQEPAVKKLKTSLSSANDIHRHIKTMNSFFSSLNPVESENPNPVSEVLLTANDSLTNLSKNIDVTSPPEDTHKTCFIQKPQVLPSETSDSSVNIGSVDKTLDPFTSNQCFTRMTADRSEISSILNSNEAGVPENSSAVTDKYFDHLLFAESDVNGFGQMDDLVQLNNAASELVATPVDGIIEDKSFVINLNGDFKTAKTILENNQTTLTNNEKEPSIHEKAMSVPISPAKSKDDRSMTEMIGTKIWSHGKHPVEKLQPVAVLTPKVIKDQSCNGEVIFKDKTNNLTELSKSVSNERKMTAFDFFCRKHRLEIASLYPEMTNHQIAQILTEKWGNLTPEEKAKYSNMIDKVYPKAVKTKEKLGSVVRQNVNKLKETPKKKKQKTKVKISERNISLDMEKIRETLHPNTSDLKLEMVNVINCIAPGIWIYSKENQLCLLNSFRVQEMAIYRRLLNTYRFEPELLQFPCIVSKDSLGEETFAFACQLSTRKSYMTETITDERITANGFEINVLQNHEEVQLQIVGMTKSISFYSILDLKEILLLLKEKGLDATLSDCRPGKITLFLQSKAVRMVRQYPPTKSVDDVKDLLKSVESFPPDCNTCLHSKPFLHELSTLS